MSVSDEGVKDTEVSFVPEQNQSVDPVPAVEEEGAGADYCLPQVENLCCTARRPLYQGSNGYGDHLGIEMVDDGVVSAAACDKQLEPRLELDASDSVASRELVVVQESGDEVDQQESHLYDMGQNQDDFDEFVEWCDAQYPFLPLQPVDFGQWTLPDERVVRGLSLLLRFRLACFRLWQDLRRLFGSIY